jgi:hypothetical protein
MMGGSG